MALLFVGWMDLRVRGCRESSLDEGRGVKLSLRLMTGEIESKTRVGRLLVLFGKSSRA